MTLSGRSILFVDDEPLVLSALKRCMQSQPCQCRFAGSGAEALRMLSQEGADVVVIDMHMPEMTGVELLGHVTTLYPDTIRLVLSGRVDSKTILDAINEGRIFRYIIKPWDDRELVAILRQAVEMKILQETNEQLLKQLQQSNQELERRVEQRTAELVKIRNIAEIGKYASQIVHDLNNPIHAIAGVIDMLRRSLVKQRPMAPDVMESWLQMAKRGVKDLKTIVSGILLHARDQSRFEQTQVDINAVVEQELKFFELDPEFKDHIERQVFLDKGLPCITGHPVQIKQVLDNLIRNAWDAMKRTERKRLTLRTRYDGGGVVIEVSDTGEGIAPENLDRIFNPDFSTKPVGQGTGLGLAGVKTMVESYAGTIDVTSISGRGATFIVTFPVSHAIPSAPHSQGEAAAL